MNDPSNAVAETATLALDAAHGWTDFALFAVAIVIALAYLYVRLWHKRGQCTDCSNGTCAACAAKYDFGVPQAKDGAGSARPTAEATTSALRPASD